MPRYDRFDGRAPVPAGGFDASQNLDARDPGGTKTYPTPGSCCRLPSSFMSAPLTNAPGIAARRPPAPDDLGQSGAGPAGLCLAAPRSRTCPLRSTCRRHGRPPRSPSPPPHRRWRSGGYASTTRCSPPRGACAAGQHHRQERRRRRCGRRGRCATFRQPGCCRRSAARRRRSAASAAATAPATASASAWTPAGSSMSSAPTAARCRPARPRLQASAARAWAMCSCRLPPRWRSPTSRCAAARLRLVIANDNLATSLKRCRSPHWRLQAGLVSSLEAEQARAAAEQTRAQLPALQTTSEQTRHALAVLTGQPPAALADGARGPGPAAPGAGRTGRLRMPAETLRQRPDVRAAELQVQRRAGARGASRRRAPAELQARWLAGSVRR